MDPQPQRSRRYAEETAKSALPERLAYLLLRDFATASSRGDSMPAQFYQAISSIIANNKEHRTMHSKLSAHALCLAIIGASAAGAWPALADDDGFPGDLSANVGLFSDYAFRGISQTDESFALQGGIDYEVDTGVADTGVYLGLWGSNVDFSDGDEAHLELDLYGGIYGSAFGFDWMLGGVGYLYPGASSSLDYNFAEVAVGLNRAIGDVAEVSLAYSYSPDYFASTGSAHYLQGGASVGIPLPESIANAGVGLSAEATLGQQWIQDNDGFGTPDYLTWSLGAAASYKMLTVGVVYADTDLSDSQCFGGTELCGARVIGYLEASF